MVGVTTIVVDQIATIVVDCDNCEHCDNCDHINYSHSRGEPGITSVLIRILPAALLPLLFFLVGMLAMVLDYEFKSFDSDIAFSH